jgi:hypothetical protein
MAYKKICGLCRNVKEIRLVTATGMGRGDRTCSEPVGAEILHAPNHFSVSQYKGTTSFQNFKTDQTARTELQNTTII